MSKDKQKLEDALPKKEEETLPERYFNIDITTGIVDKKNNPVQLKDANGKVLKETLTIGRVFQQIIDEFDKSYMFEEEGGYSEELENLFTNCVNYTYGRDAQVTFTISEKLYARLIGYGLDRKIITWYEAYQIKNAFNQVENGNKN